MRWKARACKYVHMRIRSGLKPHPSLCAASPLPVDLLSIKPLQRMTSHMEEKKKGEGGGGKKQPLFQRSYPLPKQHILLRVSLRSPNGETAISRQLSSRQGAMPTRCRAERGRQRQSWCQLELLTPLSRPCSPVSQVLAGSSLCPAASKEGALAHRAVPAPHLCPPKMSPSRSHCKTPSSCSGKDPIWERMLQKRT